jgi:hypothetical protein
VEESIVSLIVIISLMYLELVFGVGKVDTEVRSTLGEVCEGRFRFDKERVLRGTFFGPFLSLLRALPRG